MSVKKWVPFVDVQKFSWELTQQDNDLYEMVRTATDEIIRYELDLEEEAIRSKLIELGWTPPASGKLVEIVSDGTTPEIQGWVDAVRAGPEDEGEDG